MTIKGVLDRENYMGKQANRSNTIIKAELLLDKSRREDVEVDVRADFSRLDV